VSWYKIKDMPSGFADGDDDSGSGGDNLGNHTATENISLNDNWISNDGDDEGINIENDGDIYASKNIEARYDIKGGGNVWALMEVYAPHVSADFDISGPYIWAVHGSFGQNYGAYGEGANYIKGFLGTRYMGAYGQYSDTKYGYLGSNDYGAFGQNGDNYGILGGSSFGVYAVGSSHAGQFVGQVGIVGTLTKTSGSFKIDHPLDPAHKYLYHSFVESPDMMNIYNGNVTLNAQGESWVELPEWFEALNKDFRYQLTPIGASGPNLFIAEKISNNRFKIAGGEAGMEVSWQVTGIRQDAYANAHRIPVEEEKTGDEQGKYLHPEVHGMPESTGIHYEHMKKIEDDHKRKEQEHQKMKQEMEEERKLMEERRNNRKSKYENDLK